MKSHKFALVLLAGTLASTHCFAHGTLLASLPKSGSTVEVAPREFRLRFNEPVEPKFTVVKLVGQGGKEFMAQTPRVDGSDTNSVVLDLPQVPAGAYRAQWSTMGHDGHRVKGEISFSVR